MNTKENICARSRTHILSVAIAGAVAAALLLPAPASAQIEEVVVTAQKREEPLQDVPVAVTAFTTEALDTWGIDEAADIVLYTPGLNSAQQGGSNRSFFLRGVGTFDFHLTAASAVGQYFDGITLTSGFQARAALFDMERVEVLKGPQNTLFGLNTTGGAVNYITRQAEVGQGTQGTAEVKAGSDGLFGLDAAVGFDNQQNLAVRLALRNESWDGPFTSNHDGKAYGDEDLTAYRGNLLYQLGDNTSLRFTLHGSDNSNNGHPVLGVGTRQTNDASINTDTANPANPNSLPVNRWGLELCDGFVDSPVDFGAGNDCLTRGNPNLDQPPADPSVGDFKTTTQDLGFEDTSVSGFFFKLAHAFDFATLNLSIAQDSLDVKMALDGDGSQNDVLSLQQEESRDIFQTELRLTSGTDSAFRWIAGLFILDYDSQGYTGVTSPGFTGGRRPNVGRTLANVQLDHTKENTGIYGQIEYDFTDRLTLTAGLRVSDEEIVGDYLPSSPLVDADLLAGPLFTADVNRLVDEQFGSGNATRDPTTHDARGFELARQVSRTLTNSDTGYTFKLDWKATENSMVYGSISTGFKGSALDIRAAYALVPVANVITGLSETQLDPESLDALEVGYKTSFADNRLQLDLSWFSYTYNDLQQFITAMGVPTLDNAPEAEISGIDGSLRYAVNSFYLDLGFSTLDAQVTDATDSGFAEGDLGNAPELSWSLLASNEFVLGQNLLTLTGGLSHVGEHTRGNLLASNNNVTGLLTEPAYTLVNLHLAYRFGPEHRYNVNFAALNLTDENFCGVRIVNDGNSLVAATHNAAALNYNVQCRTSRAATSTFEVGFGINF